MDSTQASPPLGDIKSEVNQLKAERILGAATELFSRRGYSNVTMDDIARSIGVTKPFLYYRFKDKADILAAICGRGATLARLAVGEAAAAEGSYTDRLRAFCARFTEAVLDHADFILIYQREVANLRDADRRSIKATRVETDAILRALLARGQEAGEFAPVDPAIAASSITGMVSFIVEWHRPRLGIPKAHVVATITELALRMAGARAT